MLPPGRTIQARYRLVFNNQVTRKAFTSRPIDPIEVAIFDTCIKSNISSDCSLSSARVRLAVLSAEPWENKGENWSRSEFNKSILRAREGKAPILTGGSLTIRLRNGLGTFGNIIFTDNSSWSNGKFRLGVMVEGEGEEGFFNGERVLEGVSESIRVLDRRGEASQKPDLLKLTDNVQSIRKVANVRASLLQNNNIITVEDFLWRCYNNQSELREILGIKSEYDQRWKSMIEHAMKCHEFHAKYNVFKVSMSNSDYVGPLSPYKKPTIKFILKFIAFLAGFKRRARMVLPAQYQPLENTSQPQQDLVHLNAGPHFVGSGSSEPNPSENYIIDGDIPAMCMQIIGEIQHYLFHETTALVHPMERNMSLYTNDGPHVVSSGSSEPNPHENNRIEESAIYKQFSAAICGNFSTNVSNEHISTASGEHIAGTQHTLYPETNALVHPMGRNMSLCTNGGPPVVGLGPSEPNPSDMPATYVQFSAICDISSMNVLNEHISTASVEYIVETQHPPLNETSNHANVESRNILNGNSVQHTNGGESPQLELSSDVIPMEYLDTTDAESTPNYFTQFPSRSDDFECFTGNMSSSVDVGPPLTPRKKRKLMAFVRSAVAFLAVPRKRARIVALANQMAVPAI